MGGYGGNKRSQRSMLHSWLTSISCLSWPTDTHQRPQSQALLPPHAHFLSTPNPQVLLLVSWACQFPSAHPGFEGFLRSPPLLDSPLCFFLPFQRFPLFPPLASISPYIFLNSSDISAASGEKFSPTACSQ